MIKVSFHKKLVTKNGDMPLHLDFSFREGEFISLFGESGAGKTTALRVMAGLTLPEEGIIQVGEETWLDTQKKINRRAQDRRVGYVSQDYSLFPHMTVRENLEFALKDTSDKHFIDEHIAMMRLKGLEDRLPVKLSGGERQRVALIRALICRPKILLLDEPLAALDGELRVYLQEELLRIHRQMKITIILVTHDLSEVFKLSQKTFVLADGKIVRHGDPRVIFAENNISAKFKFVGQIIEIIKDELLNIITVQIGNSLARVVATDEEARRLKVGEKIIVASKAFNPIILKSNTQP